MQEMTQGAGTTNATKPLSIEWSHATNSMAKMEQAATNATVTSIECDVMCCENGQPILSHPPSRKSDITVSNCIKLITQVAGHQSGGKNVLMKNIKFDFKEIESVQPTLDILTAANLTNPHSNTIFLNADILPGPGLRNVVAMDPNVFLRKCIDFCQLSKEENMQFSLSLGYKCNWESDEGYRDVDVAAMADLARQYNLNDSKIGLVLALNARCLSKRTEVFQSFLDEFPHSTILAWTGAGEPGIEWSTFEKLNATFNSSTGQKDRRIEFDCHVLSIS